ncbi:hypothetical protein HS048_24210 [Planomonospora sp. ID91781]|uniref:hypothetical protein n=1 Tax=Planomonospora sp. ID91781 TaxID=2738135 RepID=UPI0018C39813|nr:hypothetical protein [Planomonospora sp. ID91781]MBG0823829.1 hypothetical protein [Planomonospora sp. ID91781]
MTFRAFLISLTAGACALPMLVATAAPVAADDHVAIRSITLRPASPVVHPDRPVRLIIEVVARGVSGRDGVTIKVEPGAPPVSSPSAGSPQDRRPGQEGAQRLPEPGWRTWRFLPERRLNRWYPTGLWTVTATAKGEDGSRVVRHAGFRLRHATDFSALQLRRADRGVQVRGVLNRIDPEGYLDYAPFPRQRVEILHRPEQGEEWTRVATATTDRGGRFIRKVRGYRGGEWRVRFPGTNRHAPEAETVRRAA